MKLLVDTVYVRYVRTEHGKIRDIVTEDEFERTGAADFVEDW